MDMKLGTCMVVIEAGLWCAFALVVVLFYMTGLLTENAYFAAMVTGRCSLNLLIK